MPLILTVILVLVVVALEMIVEDRCETVSWPGIVIVGAEEEAEGPSIPTLRTERGSKCEVDADVDVLAVNGCIAVGNPKSVRVFAA